jgi:hypothetical protein
VLGVAFLIAVALAIYAFQQRTTAHQKSEIAAREMDLRMQAQEAERNANREKENADQQRMKAEDAESRAKAADALAESEAQQSKRNADVFMRAMQAQAKAQRLAEVELEAEAYLQQSEHDLSPKEFSQVKDGLEKKVADAKEQYQRAASDAARKTGEAFVVMGAARNIGTDRISSSDVFDIASGAEVTNASGAKNPKDMFSGATGSSARATVFPDGGSMEAGSPIEFRTKNPTTIRSVALFAAHDSIRYRRAFKWFVLYARNGGKLEKLVEYTPALPYGGNCSKDSCLPNIRYAPGTVLSVCVNVSNPVQTQHYVAEFYQAVSRLEGFSGPRVLQLDGYAKPNCEQ